MEINSGVISLEDSGTIWRGGCGDIFIFHTKKLAVGISSPGVE
jgi:hypothetical protein